ncbi:MAG: NUDIX hydrolase [Conexivisphaerales archaeon]
MREWKLIDSKEVLIEKVFTVKKKKFKVEDDSVEIDVVEHPGAVAVLPRTEDDTLLLEKQYRPAIAEEIFEFPAGTINKGEDPASCAARELEEETGYVAVRLKKLGSIVTAPGYCTERITLFYADAKKAGSQRLEKDEDIELVQIDSRQIWSYIREGKVVDSKSIALVTLAFLNGLLSPVRQLS